MIHKSKRMEIQEELPDRIRQRQVKGKVREESLEAREESLDRMASS